MSYHQLIPRALYLDYERGVVEMTDFIYYLNLLEVYPLIDRDIGLVHQEIQRINYEYIVSLKVLWR